MPIQKCTGSDCREKHATKSWFQRIESLFDKGRCGATHDRPALERFRDLAAGWRNPTDLGAFRRTVPRVKSAI